MGVAREQARADNGRHQDKTWACVSAYLYLCVSIKWFEHGQKGGSQPLVPTPKANGCKIWVAGRKGARQHALHTWQHCLQDGEAFNIDGRHVLVSIKEDSGGSKTFRCVCICVCGGRRMSEVLPEWQRVQRMLKDCEGHTRMCFLLDCASLSRALGLSSLSTYLRKKQGV